MTATLFDTNTATLPTAKRPHVANNGGNAEWYTPEQYIEAARAVMGAIDCDPASCIVANMVVRADVFYTAKDNGLHRPWGRRVWLNPPYAQPLVVQFADALIKKLAAGEVQQACVLVNNATETIFAQHLMAHASAVCFPAGRVHFWHPQRIAAPLQGQMILYFGDKRESFIENFRIFGACCIAPTGVSKCPDLLGIEGGHS